MVINDELLASRKKVSQRRPKFIRQESWRYYRLAVNWRRPKGKDNKMRKQKAGVPATVKIGYRGPKAARGLHPSGYTDNLITKPNDLLHLDPKTDAARISSTVGERKRIEITVKASEMGIKLLNAGDHPKNTEKKVQEQSEAT